LEFIFASARRYINYENSNFLISYKQSYSRDTGSSYPATVFSLPVTTEALFPLKHRVGPEATCIESGAKQRSEMLTRRNMNGFFKSRE
jgi:hypothetical protein